MAVMMLTSSLALLGGISSEAAGAANPSAPGVVVAPSAPQNLVADSGDGEVWLWWDHPASQGSELIKVYYVYRGNTASTIDPAPYATVDVGEHLFKDIFVDNGNTYWYQLRAESDADLGPASNIVSANPNAGGTVPGAPTGLTVDNLVYSTLLSWNAPSSAGSQPVRYYHIYRSSTTSISYDFSIASFDWRTTSFEDTGIIPGKTYYYVVVAESIIGDGAEMTPVSVLVKGTSTVPTAPQNLMAMPGDNYTYLVWSAPVDPSATGILKYQVFRGLSSGGESITPIGEVTPFLSPYFDMLLTMFIDDESTGLTNDVMYYYYVKAVGTEGTSPQSNEVFAQPSNVGERPGAPLVSGFEGVGAYSGDDQVIIFWTPNYSNPGYVVNITGYEIFRSTTSGTLGGRIGTVDMFTTHYWDNNALNGQTYYYSVKAKWQLGLSEPSSQLVATPSATGTAPGISTLWATPDGSGVRLFMAGPAPLTTPLIIGYSIYRGTVPGGEGASPIATLTIEDIGYPNEPVSQLVF